MRGMNEDKHPFTDVRFFSKHPYMEYVFIVSACCGQLVTQAATTNALTHMYQLKDDFNTPESMNPWFIAAFGLSVGTLIIMSGRIGDAYGIRNALNGGYIWTVIWSILSGISWYDRHDGASFYICCRAFQGVGVAFILPNALGAVGRIYTPGTMRKKLVIGCIGFCAPAGGFVGAFMSGVIAVKTKDWYWNYYAFAIFSAIAGLMTYISTPDLKPALTPEGKHQSLDLIGGFLIVSALTLFNFSWNQAPVVGWNSAYIITLLVVSVPLFVAFVLWEIKMAKNPLIPPEVLGNTRLLATLWIVFLGWGAFGVNIYHFFTLLQEYRHYSSFAAGAGLAPAPPMGIIAAISCSLLISRKTDVYILLGAMLAFTATSIILATAKVDESYFRNTMGAWFIAPFGMDWSFPAASIILSEELPPHFQGLAGSLVTVCMNYGISIFLGVAGTVEQELINRRPDDKWRAWRGSLYFNIGISGMASLTALYFVICKIFKVGGYANEDEAELEDQKQADDEEKQSSVSTPPKEITTRRDSISELSVK